MTRKILRWIIIIIINALRITITTDRLHLINHRFEFLFAAYLSFACFIIFHRSSFILLSRWNFFFFFVRLLIIHSLFSIRFFNNHLNPHSKFYMLIQYVRNNAIVEGKKIIVCLNWMNNVSPATTFNLHDSETVGNMWCDCAKNKPFQINGINGKMMEKSRAAGDEENATMMKNATI